jgi:hypothetical protein
MINFLVDFLYFAKNRNVCFFENYKQVNIRILFFLASCVRAEQDNTRQTSSVQLFQFDLNVETICELSIIAYKYRSFITDFKAILTIEEKSLPRLAHYRTYRSDHWS